MRILNLIAVILLLTTNCNYSKKKISSNEVLTSKKISTNKNVIDENIDCIDTVARAPIFFDSDYSQKEEIWLVPRIGNRIFFKDENDKWFDFKNPKIGAGSKISFIDSKNGWLLDLPNVGDSQTYLYRTADSGRTWTKVEENIRDNNPINVKKLIFLDKTKGWAMDREGIWQITDAGRNWKFIQLSKFSNIQDEKPKDIFFADNQNGWIGGSKGNIYKTDNGGETWTITHSPSKEEINLIFFVDNQNGWMLDRLGYILKTENGGKTWQEISNIFKDIRESYGIAFDLSRSMFFINNKEGWISGVKDTIERSETDQPDTATGSLIYTSDGGKTWSLYPTSNIDIQDGRWKMLLQVYFKRDKSTGWIINEENIYERKGDKWIKVDLGEQ